MGEHHDTIAALSTPAGASGIAVVRLSGPEAVAVARSVFEAPTGDSGEWRHRRLYHGRIVDRGQVVDEVVCGVMRAPESYTGEDTVEISCHGNTLVVTRLLNLLFARGARSAEPGEFTKRAFLNGKMDLIQAEAVADLIHARSELQRRVAHEQLAGGLSARINELADGMLELLANIEVNIDFIEEGIETLDYEAAAATLEAHRASLDALLEGAALWKPFHEGYKVVLAGPVNAGKSSIFNRLVGEGRAIVTEVPGTTRDVLREPIVLEGLLFIVQDTAGLRGTDDRVEKIGVGRAESAVGEADVVLFVVDASQPVPADVATRLARLDPTRALVVANKIDLGEDAAVQEVLGCHPELALVRVSATNGDGLDALARAMIERVGRHGLDWIARERVVVNARLAQLLGTARAQIDVLDKNLRARQPLELLALDAREVLGCYETATGKRYTDDLLGTIFSRFCIGK